MLQISQKLNFFSHLSRQFCQFRQTYRNLVTISSVPIYKFVNFAFLEDTIKRLETRQITLFQSLGLIEEVVNNTEQAQGPSGMAFNERMHRVLNTSFGLNNLKLRFC